MFCRKNWVCVETYTTKYDKTAFSIVDFEKGLSRIEVLEVKLAKRADQEEYAEKRGWEIRF